MIFIKNRLCFNLGPLQAEDEEADCQKDKRCSGFSAVPEQGSPNSGEQQRNNEQARW
jgi:hypothetical protein